MPALPPEPPPPPAKSLTATELAALVDALTKRGKGRTRVLADAVKRGVARDPRLLPHCVRALGDAAIADLVERSLLPGFGRIAAPALQSSLSIEKGKSIDARRLRVLAAVLDRAEVAPLLATAATKGSPEIRAVAMGLLGELDAALAEPIALRHYAADRSLDVRKAAVGALGGGASDAALDALCDAFRTSDLRGAASSALARSTHPRATPRALAFLTPELLGLGALKLPRGKKADHAALAAAHAEQVALLSATLDLLASRADKLETAERVLAVFHEHAVGEVRNAAAQALLKSGHARAFDELARAIVGADSDTQQRFLYGILAATPDQTFDRLGRFLDPASLKGKSAVSFAHEILGALHGEVVHETRYPDDGEGADDARSVERRPTRLQREPRWVDAAIALIDHKDLVTAVIELLAVAPSDRAREALIARMAGDVKRDDVHLLVEAIAPYRDPRVSPLLLKFLDVETRFWCRELGFDALRDHDDPAVVPLLRAWAAGKKKLSKNDRAQLDETLTFLTRDRSVSARAG